jgi:hypothetical protein
VGRPPLETPDADEGGDMIDSVMSVSAKTGKLATVRAHKGMPAYKHGTSGLSGWIKRL